MSYGWPLKPFGAAHPVRAYFDDPRISGRSRAFHFGIDVSAPNGTPVFAVEAGTVHLEDARAVSIVTGEGEFGYWHVVPAVETCRTSRSTNCSAMSMRRGCTCTSPSAATANT